MNLREDALSIFRAGVDAADPEPLTARAIADTPLARRILVVGAGKAAPAMARGALSALSPDARVDGVLLVPEGVDTSQLAPIVVREVRPRDRNQATDKAVRMTEAVLERARALGPNDALLCLLSGGGSATLAAPWPGIPLTDKLAAVRLLDGHGAPIAALNTLRRHLSLVKGGRLALAAAGAAAVVSLMLSDVDRDAPEAVASGPCVPDPTTFADTLALLDSHEALDGLPDSVREHLLRGARGEIAETPKTLPDKVTHRIVGSPADALRGATAAARGLGYVIIDLGRGATPEAHQNAARRSTGPTCILSAGEWPVVLPHLPAPGGRAGHSALALAVALDGDPATRGRATVLCGATDGEDGTSGSAGALVDAAALRRAEADGLDPGRLLERGESLRALSAGGALLPGGPTGTNVQDLRVVLIS